LDNYIARGKVKDIQKAYGPPTGRGPLKDAGPFL